MFLASGLGLVLRLLGVLLEEVLVLGEVLVLELGQLGPRVLGLVEDPGVQAGPG